MRRRERYIRSAEERPDACPVRLEGDLPVGSEGVGEPLYGSARVAQEGLGMLSGEAVLHP